MLTLNAITEQSTWEIIGGAGKGVPWVRQEFESEWGCAHETCASLAEFTFARKIPGGGVLAIMDYTGRLHPKGVLFQAGRT